MIKVVHTLMFACLISLAVVGCKPTAGPSVSSAPAPEPAEPAPVGATPEASEMPEPAAGDLAVVEGLKEGLIAQWKFDSRKGFTDVAGSEYVLSLRNGEDGKDIEVLAEGGLRLSGDDSLVLGDTSLADTLGAGSLTLSCWVRTQDFLKPSMLVGFYTRDPQFYVLELRLHGEQSVLFNIQDQTKADMAGGINKVAGGSRLNNGQWHHIAGVRDFGNSLSLYIDGNFVRSTEDLGWPIPSGLRLYFSGLYQLNGDLDEISVWSRALSAEEVAALHALGR